MDSIVSLTKQQQQPQRRTSLTNILSYDKNNSILKTQKPILKNIDKLKNAFKRMQNQLIAKKFQQFDLKQLHQNDKLIKNNRQFSHLLTNLQLYNKKIQQNRQTDIINYKLYQFIYFTMKICNTKTQRQVNIYLKQVDHWLSQYNKKRQIIIHANKKKDKKCQQDIIRQTYKSNLPLQIDQYNRKICRLSVPNGNHHHKLHRNQDRHIKINTISNKFYEPFDMDHSNQSIYDDQIKNDQDYNHNNRQKNKDKEKEKDRKNKKNQFELPDLRSYKMQVARLRSVIEQRQDQKMLKQMKKNQSRIQSQSSNNFYKPLKNKKDIFIKTSATFKQQKQLQQKQKQLKIKQDENIQSSNNTKRQLQQDQQNKENRLIVNSTCLGFNEIKKKNLNKQLGKRNDFNLTSTFPRFFSNTSGHIGSNIGKEFNASQFQGICKQYQPNIASVSGLNLIRNPFEITKNKKDKKNK